MRTNTIRNTLKRRFKEEVSLLLIYFLCKIITKGLPNEEKEKKKDYAWH